jgi:hypothetical protein
MAAILALTSALLLAACEPDRPSDQPLPGDLVEIRLTGHTARVDEVNGGYYYLTFSYSGVTRVASDAPQYLRWRANEKGELCLQKADGETCAPLYQLTVGRFRWGATIFTLTSRY